MNDKIIRGSENPEGKNSNKIFASVIIFLLIFLGVRVVFLFGSFDEFWGINQLHYLPVGLAIILVVVSLLGIYIGWSSKNTPKIRSLKESKKSKTQLKKKDKVSSDLPKLVIVTIAFGILFLTFQVAWPFLGDGSIFVGYLFNFHASGKITVWWREAPSMYLQYGIYYLKILLGGKASSFFPFTVISLISGVLFVGTSFRFAKAINKNLWMQWLIFGLLMSAGGTLFCFGYMETYPLQYACVLIYCYFSYQYLQGKVNIIRPALILALCIILHLQNILLIPSFIFLFTFKNLKVREEVDKKRSVIRSLIIIIPVLLAIYLFLQWHPLSGTGTGENSPFIPLFPSMHFTYTLFSFQHLLDIFNENFLLNGVAFSVIIGYIIAGYKHIRWNDPFLLYLILNLFFFESLLIGGNVVFGLARDWDVCASLGIFVSLIAIILLKQILQDDAKYKKYAIPIFASAFCCSIAWIAVNVKDVSASHRYEDILDLYTPKIDIESAQYGYENLRKYYTGGYPEAEIHTIRKIVEINPRPVDVRTALATARDIAMSLSSSAKSDIQAIVERLYKINTDSIFTQETFAGIRIGGRFAGEGTTLGDFYENGIDFMVESKIISYQEALNKADSFILKHSALTYGYELRGYLMSQFAKDTKGSIPYLEKSILIDPSHTRTYNLLGIAYAINGDRPKAKENLRYMVHLDPSWISGLESYISFLTNGVSDISDTTDLLLVRQSLTTLISTPPESETKMHIEQNTAIVNQAQKLRNKVDSRLQELRVIH